MRAIPSPLVLKRSSFSRRQAPEKHERGRTRSGIGGRVRINGRDRTGASPLEVRSCGVGHVPEDRLGTGVAPNLSVADNLLLNRYREPEFGRGPLLDRRAMLLEARRLIGEFGIRTTGPAAPARTLSGGNLQRLILAREVGTDPRLILAFHPTRGLDVGATETVHRLLVSQRRAGAAMPPVLRVSVAAGATARDFALAVFRTVTSFERRLAATFGAVLRGLGAPARDLHTGDAQEYLLFLVGVGVLALLLPLLR